MNEPLDASFSLIGIDASLANAFRRILIAEIPTLAIEHLFIFNNTSIIQDEVLAHRIGLVPLTGNPEGLRAMGWSSLSHKPANGEQPIGNNDRNTAIIKLSKTCTFKKDVNRKTETDPLKLYDNAHIYARDLEYIPTTDYQRAIFSEENGPIRPVNPDILLAKLRPGQEIQIEMHAVKSIGADHAKFSPVATASYRLLPTISINQPIFGADAKKFARCFPKGVIGLEEVTAEETSLSGFKGVQPGDKKAVVKNAFKDTVSRECLRHEEFAEKVKLGRVRDHFIFSVESTGQFRSDELFIESVKTLKAKCTDLKRNLAMITR